MRGLHAAALAALLAAACGGKSDDQPAATTPVAAGAAAQPTAAGSGSGSSKKEPIQLTAKIEDALPPVFDQYVYPTLKAKCASCHSPSTVPKDDKKPAPFPFVSTDPAQGYLTAMRDPQLAGKLTPESAGILTRIDDTGPHKGLKYVDAEKAGIVAWLKLEKEYSTIRHRFVEDDFVADANGDKGRDPFQSFVVTQAGLGAKPTTDNTASEGKKCARMIALDYSLRDLRLSAIFTKGLKHYALFQDSADVGQELATVHDCLGKEKALISDISDGVVTLELTGEQVPNQQTAAPTTEKSIPVFPPNAGATITVPTDRPTAPTGGSEPQTNVPPPPPPTKPSGPMLKPAPPPANPPPGGTQM